MLATLLAQPAPTAEARALMWRQVVDVLAQGRGHHVDDPLVDAPRAMDAYNFLRSIRPEIPTTVRQSAGRALAGRRVPPELIRLFAEDLPHIAAPALGGALLYEDEWLALLPYFAPSARNLLRNRRDLGEEVAKALDHFGSSDFLISGPTSAQEAVAPLVAEVEPVVAAAAEPEPAPEIMPSAPVSPPPELQVEVPALKPAQSETQIRDLLSRIETFRARHMPPVAPDAAIEPPHFDTDGDADGAIDPDAADQPLIESFRFETGVDGIICRVQGAPDGVLIGETIAVAARQTDHGVDGHAAGAYRSRTPFRDARLTIAGNGPVAGEWRISAVPFFDSRDNRFGGYRGSARRPRADETAKTMNAAPSRTSEPASNDSLHKLVKELRTPLAAIIDFSEAIDGQPAVAPYRTRAQEILEQSRKLLSAVEDLDLIAAARSDDGSDDGASVDAAAILMRLHGDFEDVVKERSSDLAFRIDPELPLVAADSATVERMLSRMLAATIAMSSEGERISVDLQRDPRRPGRLLMTIIRPRALAGRDEKMLLDPGYNPDGHWPDAPVLGLGFALRLVRNLALACGGMLEIDSTRFYLCLPLRDAAAQARNGKR